jgi:outer membrane receptor protein involved in Fe transport
MRSNQIHVRCRQILRALASSLALLAIFAFPVWAQGQAITGWVHDASGAAIVGAQVQLQTNSSVATAVTDSTGKFSFPNVAAPQGKITVTADGMEPLAQSWNSSTQQPLDLTMQPQTMVQQIVVTAARTQTRLGDTPTSMIQLSGQELQATPNFTLDDALRQVPGFSIFRRSSSRTANPTTEGVSLRGTGASGASRVLVLDNGIPLNDPFGGWVYWDRVPSSAIANVEVDQEGASSLYGSNALGGVVQVLTRSPQPAGASLELAYGNQNSPDFSAWAGGSHGGWYATGDTQLFHTDGYYLVPQAFRGSVDTKANSEYATTDLTLGRKIGQNSRIFASGSYLDESRNNGTQLQVNDTSMGQGALGADLDLGRAGNLTLRFYGVFEHYYQTFSSVAGDQNSETLTNRQTVPSQGVGGSAVWSHPIGQRQTLVAGYDEHEEIGHSNEIIGTVASPFATQTGGGRQRSVGVFGEDLIQVASNWTLGLSARYDHWRNFEALISRTTLSSGAVASTLPPDVSYDVFNPRATLVHQLNDHVSWSGSVYRAFRAPTLNELYRQFRVGATTTLANPALRAERLTGGETGVAVTGFDRKLVVRGTFFYNQMVNSVANVPCPKPAFPGSPCPANPPANTQIRANLGRVSAPGFEIDATARVASHFNFSAGYQYVNAKVVSAPLEPTLVGTDVQEVPHNALTFQAQYANPHWIDFTFDGRFLGQQLDTTGSALDSVFIADAMASHSVGAGFSVFAAVENLLNTKYYTAAETFSGTAVASPPQLGLPITARFGLRFDFPKR